MVSMQTVLWTNTGIFVFVSILLINMATRGFLLQFLIAKFSRGKKKLVQVHTKTDVYFKTAKVEGSQLKYKDHAKEEHALTNFDDNFAKDMFGVKTFIVSEDKDALLNKEFESQSGYDAVQYDLLQKRALMKPSLDMNTEKLVQYMKIGLLVIVGNAAITLFLVYQLMKGGGKGII